MSVAVIIPVYNLWEKMTLPCLRSLAKHTDLDQIQIYLVDNASADETFQHAAAAGNELFGGRFVYMRNGENLGFAKACNQGAEQARNDGNEYLFFLNNDTLVTENWLDPLLEEIKNPRVAAAGPLLLYPDDTVQHCGVIFDCYKSARHIYRMFPKNHPLIRKKRKFRAITGAAFFCRTKDFFEAGQFFPEYKNGFEDLELCMQFVRMGLVCSVVPQSIVYHLESQTPVRRNKDALVHNVNLFYSRNADVVADGLAYYVKDGYVPALTKDFFFYVRLTEEKRRELNNKAKENYSDERCLAMLCDEPYWHDGYHLLADSYLKQKRYVDAVNMLDMGLACCNRRGTFEKLVDTVKIFAEPEIQRKYEEKLAAMNKDYALSLQLNPQKLKKNLFQTPWYEKLLATQELDTDDFGI